MTKKADLVEERFSQVNCAQTVFSLYAEDLGIDEETTLKIASGFGGGMKRGATCGAITGAYMVIGLKYGNTHNDSEEKLALEQKIRKFNNHFKKIHGTLNCRELIDYNISTIEEKDAAREAGVFQNICPKLLKTACNILYKEF